MRRPDRPRRSRHHTWTSVATCTWLLGATIGCSPTTPEAEQPAAASTSEPVEDGPDATLPAAPALTEPLDDAGVERRVAELREILVPPEGAAKKDVDAVYGEPRVVEWKQGMKGHPKRYPMHVYDLLPAEDASKARQSLGVTYRANRLVGARLWGHGVKGQRAGVPGTDAAQRAALRRTLEDLEKIERIYRARLEAAGWVQSDGED